MKRLYSVMNEPLFDQKELQMPKEREDAAYKRDLSDPDNAYTEFRTAILYKGQKSGLSAKERNDIIQKLTQKDLKDIYKKYFKAESLIVTLFGDLTRTQALAYAGEIKSKIPSGKITGAKTPIIVPKINETFVNECEFEQVNIEINFQAPFQDDPDYYAMTALNQVMSNGFSGRILKATRVNDDLVYSAYSYYSGTKDYGFYRIEAQTSLAKKDRLLDVLKKEVQRLIDGDITQEEIDLSVESYAKMLEGYFTDNNMAGMMTSYESRGLGYNFLKESLKDLKKVTPEMIKAVSGKYLKDAAIFVSQPSADVKRVVE
jgi:predicted Zn-dependent peptidase